MQKRVDYSEVSNSIKKPETKEIDALGKQES